MLLLPLFSDLPSKVHALSTRTRGLLTDFNAHIGWSQRHVLGWNGDRTEPCQWWSLSGNPSDVSTHNLQLLKPWKINMFGNPKIEVWKMMTPLKSGDSLGSMFILRGVYQEMKTVWRNLHSHYVHILNYYTFTNISCTCSQKQLTISCFFSKTVWYLTCIWKWMVGILVPFWGGLFSEASC